MSLKISIIVPVYKVEPYIHKCVDSILAQTFKDFELILVDDGSPDNCGQICDEYAQKDSRVKVIHKENGGVSSARNVGIDTALGEYITFIDPDDIIEQNMYQVLFEHAIKYSADIVVCPIRSFNEVEGTISISTVWLEGNILDKKNIEEKIIPSILRKKYYSILSVVNKLYQKKFFDQYELRFDENKNHGEDARLNLILLTHINRLVFVKEPLYNYFIRKGNSLTRKFREDYYDYILDNKNFGLSLCDKYNIVNVVDNLNSEFIITTLNFMQDIVNSNLSQSKKDDLLIKIINDNEFKKHLTSSNFPSIYYRFLISICKFKSEKLFTGVVKLKVSIKNLCKGIVLK